MARIIGVRYIGLKDEVEDSVTNSGAVWKQGETHNFAEPLARQLLVHTDSFEQVQPSMNGDNFLSGKIGGKQVVETATYMNLNTMDSGQLAYYAHVEFNKRLDVSSKTVEQLRVEVQTMMSIATLDDIERQDIVDADSNKKVAISVTDAEHTALNEGTLIVRLIPAEAQTAFGLSAEQARAILDEHGIVAILDSSDDLALLSKNAPLLRDAYFALRDLADMPEADAAIDSTVGDSADAVAPSADEIGAMNKEQLLALAAEHSVTFNDAAPVVTMRKQLIAALYSAE